MLKLKCSYKRLRHLGLQIWCLTTERTRPTGRIGHFGNLLIVLTRSPLLYYSTYHILEQIFPTTQSRYYGKFS